MQPLAPSQSLRTGAARTRLLVALVIAGIALASYFLQSTDNPITGESQRVSLSVDDEIRLGLQSEPTLVRQHLGEDPSREDQALLDRVGNRLVAALLRLEDADDPVYPFEFTLLRDPETVNAFALPGGRTFITRALFDRFDSEGQLAAVMAHEIGHVVHRHSAERLAKQQLTQGLVGSAVMASGDAGSGQLAQAIGSIVNMKYGRQDELESDTYGVRLMAEAGYDPRSMVTVMRILNEASGGRGGGPEFLSTHPNPRNRIERIQAAIDEVFPSGVPDGLER